MRARSHLRGGTWPAKGSSRPLEPIVWTPQRYVPLSQTVRSSGAGLDPGGVAPLQMLTVAAVLRFAGRSRTRRAPEGSSGWLAESAGIASQDARGAG